MKKIFFFILIGITLNSFGQDVKLLNKKKPYFGVKTGFNIVKSSNYNDGSHLNYGYQIGTTFTIPISSKFSFQPELLFQSIGYSNKYVNVYSNGTTSNENKLRNTYLQFPLNFKYEITNKFNIELGPNIAFLLNSKKMTHSEYDLSGTNSTFDSSSDNTANYKKFGFGINLGTNYLIVPNVYAGLRYTLMIASYQTIKSTMDNSIFAFSIGYSFR